MTVGRSENGSDDLWIGEMGLSARNGKTVDQRNEGGSEKNEIGVRNVFRKLTVSVDWIGAWIGVDRSGSECGSEFAWSGSELVSFSVWSGSELGSWADRSWVRVDRSDVRRVRRAWILSGSEWIGTISVECVELGSLLGHFQDRSLAASSHERIGAWQSSACVRGLCVWQRGGNQLKWK